MNFSTDRDAIIKYITEAKGNPTQKRLAELRLQYSEISTLRNTTLSSLQGVERIYPTILPTQASGRWSYLKPNISSFSKKCINPNCPKGQHEKTTQCWASRDCLRPDEGTFWIEHDLDAVEHRIYCLVLGWTKRLADLQAGVDIHTPVCCSIFNLPLPSNLFNPHTSPEDVEWRKFVHWQGKDDARRTIAKNMTYGGQYFFVRLTKAGEKARLPSRIKDGLWYNPSFVRTIPNIQGYKIIDTNPKSDTYNQLITPNYEELACRFVEDPENLEIQKRKAALMAEYRRVKLSRTLYGGRRVAWFSNNETAKELFNHSIQGTVASYINESIITAQRVFPNSWIIHNHHDSLKWCFPYETNNYLEEEEETLKTCKELFQRTLDFGELSVPITATFKIVRRENR